MAKIDWKQHEDRFFKQAAGKKPKSLADYCAANNLNYRTAQKHIKPRKSVEKAPQKSVNQRSSSTSTQKAAVSKNKNETPKKPAGRASAGKGANKVDGTKAQNSAKKRPEKTPRTRTRDKGGDDKSQEGRLISESRKEKMLESGSVAPAKKGERHPPFGKGNQQAVKHGAYLSFDSIDDDIREVAIALSENAATRSPELALIRARMLQMQRFESEMLKEVQTKEDIIQKALAEDVITKEEILELGFSGTVTEQRARLFFSTNRHFVEMTELLSAAELNERKYYLAARKLHAISPAAQLALTKDIFDQIENKGLSAIEGAALFEKNGLKVPQALFEQAKREISFLAPPEQEGGLSEEEMDAEFDAYMDKMPSAFDELQERIGSIEDLFSQARESENQDTVEFDDEFELIDDDEGEEVL